MRLEQVEKRLITLSHANNLRYALGSSVRLEDIVDIENALSVIFPQQVRQFYLSYNGLLVEAPYLKIEPLSKVKFIAAQQLHFATVGDGHLLHFDTSTLNMAKQWSIYATGTNYRVTLTMASFWSNKIWHWIEKQLPIWREQSIAP